MVRVSRILIAFAVFGIFPSAMAETRFIEAQTHTEPNKYYIGFAGLPASPTGGPLGHAFVFGESRTTRLR
jgi:hypothetical protein